MVRAFALCRRVALVSLIASAAVLAIARGQDPHAPDAPPAVPRGLRVFGPGAERGCTLIAPILSLRTLLVEMHGRVAHEWHSSLPPGNSVYLEADGNLLRCARITDGGIFEGGGIGGRIEELAKDSTVLWEYTLADERFHQHHDIEPLPNGNILLIAWERKSYDKAVAAGRDPERMLSGEFWPDAVFEIERVAPRGGRVVWEWHVWDHLIQDLDPKRDHYGDVAAHPERVDINGDRAEAPPPGPVPGSPTAVGANGGPDDPLRQMGYVAGRAIGKDGRKRDVRGADWLHTNAIDYDPEHDQIVLSVRRFDEFWVIDHSTTTEEARGSTGGRAGRGGDILFRYGNPAASRAGKPEDQVLFGQHDAQWIGPGLPGAGHFLVFNNGAGRPQPAYSTVEEIAVERDDRGRIVPGSARVVWRYGVTEDQRFFSSFISGAQRLANGNTLICAGEQGRVFEVQPDGKVVWDYWNEHGGDAPPENGPTGRVNQHALFRATRLTSAHPGYVRLLAREF